MKERAKLDELYFHALDLETAGDVEGALRLFMQGASLGDDAAQNAVGLAYDCGAGVEQDKHKAIAWFKKAWRTDQQPMYCETIALTYAEIGRRRQALYWWRKAIDMGNGGAALSLAKFLIKSNGGISKRVLALIKLAAESQEPLDISPAQKEEAQTLLEEWSSQNL